MEVLKLIWHQSKLCIISIVSFPCGSAGKESTCNAVDLSLIPGLGRSPEEGKGNPLQCSGMENSMDCIVQGVTKSRTPLSDFHFHIANWWFTWAWFVDVMSLNHFHGCCYLSTPPICKLMLSCLEHLRKVQNLSFFFFLV